MIKKNFINQKQIADKANNTTTEFIVISNGDFTKQDWISKRKFLEITEKIGDKPVEYPLKKALKGNLDESRKSQKGKALKLALDDNMYCMDIYTQTYGQAWELSHTHHIDKSIFDAYVLVVKNDQDVLELEKNSKAPENFSLNLG